MAKVSRMSSHPVFGGRLLGYDKVDKSFGLEGQTEENKNGGSGFEMKFTSPQWSIIDFFNERTSWQKQIDSITGEPGWFYFKLFFKFDTSYGLLGGIMSEGADSVDAKRYANTNTALNYLLTHGGGKLHESQKLLDKAIALIKFVSTLSFINCNAPWFFNSISGLDKVVNLSEPTKDKELEIGCLEDAVDMRLTTLFDLYKYACYDFANYREIIPENLRKFDLTVMIMNTPLRYYQTGFKSMKNGEVDYKTVNPDGVDFSNVMSYKQFTFTNCEFVVETMNSVGAEITSDNPFYLGKNKIKIKYDHCYCHNMNEWDQLAWGDDGVSYNKHKVFAKTIDEMGVRGEGGAQDARIAAMQTAIDSVGYYNRGADVYKALVDGTEQHLNDELRNIDPSIALGNLWGQANMQRQQSLVNDIRNKASNFISL